MAKDRQIIASEDSGKAPIEEKSAPIPAWMLIIVVTALFLCFFHRPILQDQNFIYRDSGHFYYPYFKLEVQEWLAGRVPLWNPYENGGEPFAGNPTASVFYPGKLLFCLPFPLAYKTYLLGHVLLAMLTCYFASRRLGNTSASSTLAAIAYGMGGFVLFQLYNIVFLVGAAWLPLGLLAVHQLRPSPWLEAGGHSWWRARSSNTGGDPQAAN